MLHTGLWGMGGIGKTISALILAHDVDVRTKFPDGIIWLKFGDSANPLERQVALATLLGDDNPTIEKFRYEEIASARLYMLSRDLQCLVILDDVWEPQHAKVFSRLGHKCKLLITTRRLVVLEGLGAREHQVDFLSVDEAYELLATTAGLPFVVRSPEMLQIIEQCGRLPLALSAIGTLIRKGNLTWDKALKRLKEGDLYGLKVARSVYQHEGVLTALDLSIEVLHDHLKKKLLRCAVFPDDASISPNALANLWGIDIICEAELEAATNEFVDRSLFMLDDSRRFRIHDLYVVILRAKAKDLPSVHAELLDSYRNSIAENTDLLKDSQSGRSLCEMPPMWHSIPDDGYIHEHMPYHMQMAGRNRDLHDLLAEENVDGHSGWYDACRRRARTVQYYRDVSTAQTIAIREVINEWRVTPYAVSRVMFYGLIKSTFASLASHLPGEFLGCLVRQGLMSTDDAFLYAQQILSPDEKVVALVALSGVLDQDESPALLREASNVVHGIASEESLSRIVELAVHVGVNDFAHEIAKQMINKREHVINDPQFLVRVRRLIGDGIMQPFLADKYFWTPYDWRHVASFVCVQDYLDKKENSYYLGAIDRVLPHVWSATERASMLLALLAARKGVSSVDMQEVYSEMAMAPEMERGVLTWLMVNHYATGITAIVPEIMIDMEAGAFTNDMATDVARLLVLHTESLYARYLVERTRRWALSISSTAERNRAIGRIAPLLAPLILGQTLKEALGRSEIVGDIEAQVRALCAVSKYATASAQAEALGELAGVHDERVRSECLSVIVEHLSPALLIEAFELWKGLKHLNMRALYAISARIDERHLLDVLREACKWAGDVLDLTPDEAARGVAPAAAERASHRDIQRDIRDIQILRLLSAQVRDIQEVVERVVARGQRDELRQFALTRLKGNSKYMLLHALWPLSREESRQILSDIKATNEVERPAYLKNVFRHLPLSLKENAFALAIDITKNVYRARALEALAPDLPEALSSRALASIPGLNDQDLEENVLTVLAPHLSPALLIEAFELWKGLKHLNMRALYAISARIDERHLLDVLREACKWAGDVLDLTPDEAARGVAPAAAERASHRDIQRDIRDIQILRLLSAQVRDIQEVVERVVARGQRDELRQFALTRLKGNSKYMLLHALWPLSREESRQILSDIKATNEVERPAYLKNVFRHLPLSLKENAFALAIDITKNVYRARALEALAPDLPEALSSRALASIPGLNDQDLEENVLTVLAPHLSPESLETLKNTSPNLYRKVIKGLDIIDKNIQKRANADDLNEYTRDDEKETANNIVEMIGRLQGMPREIMLAQMVQHARSFARPYGYELGEEVVRMVRLVSRWWP